MAKKIIGFLLMALAAIMPLLFMAIHHAYTEAWGDGYPFGMAMSCLLFMALCGASGACAIGINPEEPKQ